MAVTNCKELEDTLPFYLYDELPAEKRAAYEKHLEACPACQAGLEDSRRLNRLLDQRLAPEPTPELVVRCRQSLDAALDREQLGWRGLFHSLPAIGLRFSASGATTMLSLVLLGFGLGWILRPHSSALLKRSTMATASDVDGS